MRKFRKAYTAAAVALVGGVGLALSDGSVSAQEILVAVGAGLLAGAAVYRVPNAD